MLCLIACRRSKGSIRHLLVLIDQHHLLSLLHQVLPIWLTALFLVASWASLASHKTSNVDRAFLAVFDLLVDSVHIVDIF